MKKIVLFSLATMLATASCKPKKQVVETKSPEPYEKELVVLKTKLPNSSLEDLQKGHEVFYGACTRCHGYKDVTGYDEERLQKIMNKMSRKANLSDEQKDALWKYALALNLSGKK